MKKRLSKKVLAIFLAALMVATSIPLSVLHVFAADAWTDAAQDAEVIKIENCVNQRESFGGTSKNNVLMQITNGKEFLKNYK